MRMMRYSCLIVSLYLGAYCILYIQNSFSPKVTQSENEVLVSLCPSGRVLAIVTRSCKAQFLVHEGKDQEALA